eukprot:CAMPEP_0175000774 /NCGR_PEP_ID=MMETSP0005-20121125/2777_1 /TAXON_ID=420556 /ORGANISM="Ochromonas sp., Strain CCMP1393" /LENGTH=985 /DNA_ID=CAMNT_0016255611 /DNA_START=378 /DNA_END=3336 /DNA_ORIENTATION=+
MWQRKVDPATGLLVWLRVPVRETKVGSAPFGYTPRHSITEQERQDTMDCVDNESASLMSSYYLGGGGGDSQKRRSGGSGGGGDEDEETGNEGVTHGYWTRGNQRGRGSSVGSLGSRSGHSVMSNFVLQPDYDPLADLLAAAAPPPPPPSSSSSSSSSVLTAAGASDAPPSSPSLMRHLVPSNGSSSGAVTGAVTGAGCAGVSTPPRGYLREDRHSQSKSPLRPHQRDAPHNGSSHHHYQQQEPQRQQQQQQQQRARRRRQRGDSFDDSVLASHSPGYTSVFDEEGELVWEKVESGNPIRSYSKKKDDNAGGPKETKNGPTVTKYTNRSYSNSSSNRGSSQQNNFFLRRQQRLYTSPQQQPPMAAAASHVTAQQSNNREIYPADEESATPSINSPMMSSAAAAAVPPLSPLHQPLLLPTSSNGNFSQLDNLLPPMRTSMMGSTQSLLRDFDDPHPGHAAGGGGGGGGSPVTGNSAAASPLPVGLVDGPNECGSGSDASRDSFGYHHHHQQQQQQQYEVDLAAIAAMTYRSKLMWFLDRLGELQTPPSDGYIKIEVRRRRLMEDSHSVISQFEPEDLHKYMRIEFHGEPGVDAGGLEREWFSLVTQAMLSPEAGFFTRSGDGDGGMGGYHINPTSGAYNKHHLSYFSFFGKFIGKAILGQQSIDANFSVPLRKQILSMPVMFSDLEFVDEELYRNLVWLKTNKNVADLMLDFSISYAGKVGNKIPKDEENAASASGKSRNKYANDGTYDGAGVKESPARSSSSANGSSATSSSSPARRGEASAGSVAPASFINYELIPGGADILVTDENKEEYLQLRLRHRMLDSIKPQLEHFLVGLYEVIPADLLSVFDYQELDLLLCGVPVIDLDDWKQHTEYMGQYKKLGAKHKVIQWFWTAVEAMSHEERIRLLQFTTGCARLPSQGFRALQSTDGRYRRFNIQSVLKKESIYPRAHTCFNKLDLPMYSNQRELDAYLSVVISMENVTGFSIE